MSKKEKILEGQLALEVHLREERLSEFVSTNLGGQFHVKQGVYVVPFNSYDNAIDCLRLVIQTLERERDGGGRE